MKPRPKEKMFNCKNRVRIQRKIQKGGLSFSWRVIIFQEKGKRGIENERFIGLLVKIQSHFGGVDVF